MGECVSCGSVCVRVSVVCCFFVVFFSRAIRGGRANDWERRSRRRVETEQRAVLRGWWRAAKCQSIAALCLRLMMRDADYFWRRVCLKNKLELKKQFAPVTYEPEGQNQILRDVSASPCLPALLRAPSCLASDWPRRVRIPRNLSVPTSGKKTPPTGGLVHSPLNLDSTRRSLQPGALSLGRARVSARLSCFLVMLLVFLEV